MIDLNRLILYRNLKNGSVLEELIFVLNNIENRDREELAPILYRAISRLVDISSSHGFYGNLWHTYLAYLIANHENSYSVACEITGQVKGSINNIAVNDFCVFKELYDIDWTAVEEALNIKLFDLLTDFNADDKSDKKVFNTRIRDRICELSLKLANSSNVEDFKNEVSLFYKEYGVGKLGLHKAFRVENINNDVSIVPITNMTHVRLDDLVGYEIAKQKLIDNTESFVKGKKANNCLLFGDAGTGKSTSVKAILNQYYDQGLRMIEIYKHQFKDLSAVISQIKNRNYKFIIYMDDLSFEEFEIEYKYLKAIIEGGLEKKPDNVLIYATSNRRHLIKERSSDKNDYDDELHSSDTVQEKLSLAARFGVTIYFGKPDKKEFQNIVKVLAKKNDITLSEEELLAEANKWELSHGGLSGRTAQQFIDHLG